MVNATCLAFQQARQLPWPHEVFSPNLDLEYSSQGLRGWESINIHNLQIILWKLFGMWRFEKLWGVGRAPLLPQDWPEMPHLLGRVCQTVTLAQHLPSVGWVLSPRQDRLHIVAFYISFHEAFFKIHLLRFSAQAFKVRMSENWLRRQALRNCCIKFARLVACPRCIWFFSNKSFNSCSISDLFILSELGDRLDILLCIYPNQVIILPITTMSNKHLIGQY